MTETITTPVKTPTPTKNPTVAPKDPFRTRPGKNPKPKA